MIAPMTARGRTLGAMTFVSSHAARRFDKDDLGLAEELARRAATAVDNARLYAERAYIARTLQESLLPPTLPEIGGVEVAARFRAAGDGNEVGGDFYDLFDTGDANWAVVMGDVCGKGAEAAALTALARYTLRAAAMRQDSPSDVLSTLNEALVRQRADAQFCTVAFARLQRDGAGTRITVASGAIRSRSSCAQTGAWTRSARPARCWGSSADPQLHDESVRSGAGRRRRPVHRRRHRRPRARAGAQPGRPRRPPARMRRARRSRDRGARRARRHRARRRRCARRPARRRGDPRPARAGVTSPTRRPDRRRARDARRDA